MRPPVIFAALATFCLALAPLSAADTTLPDEPVPVAHRETERGAWGTKRLASVTPAERVVDGEISDWQGVAPGLAGASLYSAGEYVYNDHLFDAYGADDGGDVERAQVDGPLHETVPQTYRTEAVYQANQVDDTAELPLLNGEEMYGDAGLQDRADLVEVRLGADNANVYVLAKTTTMLDADDVAMLLLADAGPGPGDADVGFGSGLRTDRADVAIFLADGRGEAVDLATGATSSVPVAANASGWTNVIEAAVPRSLIEANGHKLRIALGAGVRDGDGFKDLTGQGNLANVAFRPDEPVRVFFDKQQAFALHDGSIDAFFTQVHLTRLEDGWTQRIVPGAGYHERLFRSSEDISVERGMDGVWQNYGVYLPSAYDGEEPLPLQLWMHWRGGKTHSAATLTPRVFRDMGEARGGVVVAPRGRGTATWYLGKGQADFLEVWDDAFDSFALDADRVYVSGHSMGGWASWLLPILYPDRFAGTFPVAPPVTQGAWTGVDFEGCDDFRWEEEPDYTPCYVESNGGNARVQHTRRLLDNLRNVPLSIFHGAADELVPVAGVTQQAVRLQELGYRHRYYLFPNYEHYSHPLVDEWIEGVRYLDAFTRDPNPSHVTYIRDMPFERTVETGPNQSNPTTGLSFDFDSAYWMSELTPDDLTDGVARFDGRSLALVQAPVVNAPEAGGPAAPGQAGPYVMTGRSWLTDPLATTPTTSNAFDVSLDGATKVRLDVVRMRIVPTQAVTGHVDTALPLEMQLSGFPDGSYTVEVDGVSAAQESADGLLTITVPAGPHTVAVVPT